MNNFNYYLQLEDGLEEAREDAINEIADILEVMPDCDQISIINDYQSRYEIHRMDELDDVFRSWTPTEILDDLRDIDLNDGYFDSNGYFSSGDDPFEVANTSTEEIAKKILEGDGEIYDDINDVMTEYDTIVYKFNLIEKKRELAKELIDMADITELDEIVNLLWTRKEGE